MREDACARAKSVQADQKGYILTYLPTDLCLFESKPKGSGGYPARAFPGSTTLNVWWWADKFESPKIPCFSSNCYSTQRKNMMAVSKRRIFCQYWPIKKS